MLPEPVSPASDAERPDGAKASSSDQGGKRRRRRVVRPGTEQTSIAGASRDERGEGWSERRGSQEESAHDAELLRNLPPHWS